MADHRGEWLPANAGISPQEVTVGMTVLGSDGEYIGRVKEILPDRFLVDRQFRRDLYIPFSRVLRVQLTEKGLSFDQRLMLDVSSDRVDELGRGAPPP